MRWAIVAGIWMASAQTHAQDGAQMMTLAEVKQRRGGLAQDASGTVRLDDAGMPQDTITYLERHCAKPGAAAPAGCRGALEFTVASAQGTFTISDAQFIPQN